MKPSPAIASIYSPFGTVLYGRSWSSQAYRYGFNGKEKDTEGMGGGSQTYDYGFRIYNPALARFLSVDPLCDTYPSFSPYQFACNSPVKFIDLDGREVYVVGTTSDEFINLLAALTGLEITKDANGLLTYTKEKIQITNDDGTITENEVPKITVVDGSFVSEELQKQVINLIDGSNRVDVICSSSEELEAEDPKTGDNVLFDAHKSADGYISGRENYVDMSDFKAISNQEVLQAAIIGHFLAERSKKSVAENEKDALLMDHKEGLKQELKIIQGSYADAIERIDLTNSTPEVVEESNNLYFGYPADKFTKQENSVFTYTFNYSTIQFVLTCSYGLDEKGNLDKNVTNPSKVTGCFGVIPEKEDGKK